MHEYLQRVFETETVKGRVCEMGDLVDIHLQEPVSQRDVVVVIDGCPKFHKPVEIGTKLGRELLCDVVQQHPLGEGYVVHELPRLSFGDLDEQVLDSFVLRVDILVFQGDALHKRQGCVLFFGKSFLGEGQSFRANRTQLATQSPSLTDTYCMLFSAHNLVPHSILSFGIDGGRVHVVHQFVVVCLYSWVISVDSGDYFVVQSELSGAVPTLRELVEHPLQTLFL